MTRVHLSVLFTGLLLMGLLVTAHTWEREGTSAGQETRGPDGGVYVWVPAGEFAMGSADDDEEARRHENPRHSVMITRGFWLGKHEVTIAQYRRFCEATQRRRFFWADEGRGEDHPVVHVSWEDAQAYCAHHGLRLPTEAEWEYAARGPQSLRYPWGNEWDPTRLCFKGNQGPLPGFEKVGTYPVGSFPTGASWVGALEMAGNVSEWVKDWYSEGAYLRGLGELPGGRYGRIDPEQMTPSRDPLYGGDTRVRRGGSWQAVPGVCRGATRFWVSEKHRGDSIGFRCAISPPRP